MRKISLRLPADIYEDLRDEALQFKISISDVIRKRIMGFKDYPSQPASAPKPTELNRDHELVTLQSLYLLREFLFERNAQILKRVDEKMEKKFGAEHKRIS